MTKYITKRNGNKVEFDISKIENAVFRAANDIADTFGWTSDCCHEIAKDIAFSFKDAEYYHDDMTVEEIQDAVEELLMGDFPHVAKSYMIYRYEHQIARQKQLDEAIEEKLMAKKIDNQNANVDEHSFGGRIGEASSIVMRNYALNHCMSTMAKENHLNNEIYIHDLDHYAVGDHNCLSIPFDKLLREGFNTRQVDIRPANSVNTAFQLVAVIFQLQSLQQFGGVSATHLDWTMVPYVRKSFRKHFIDGLTYCEPDFSFDIKEYSEHIPVDASIESQEYRLQPNAYKYAMDMTEKEVYQAVEGMYHNLNSLQSRSGNQLPFTSVNYGTCTLPEGRMVIKALLEVSIEGVGKLHKTSIFPCSIFQCMKGVNRKEGEPNYDLFRLALKSTAKRLYPNYVNVDWSNNAGYDINDPRTYTSTMGCRTYNGYDINGFGQLKDGRGNICPVTIILPTLAMESGRNVKKFMELLDKKLFEAKDMLIERFEYICSQNPASAKFMYENGVMAGYVPEEGIRSALKHGTLAIGQIGLAETLELLIGKNQRHPEGMALAKRIESHIRQRCDEFKKQYKLNFGNYFTPAENLCYKAMSKFKDKYGIIPNVSDREYFTNSVHTPVWEKVTPFEKIDIESQLTGYSSAGCITYVELESTVKHNIDALEKVVNYAMDKDIPYFAINVPNDTCLECGYCDEFNDECPVCGSHNIQQLRRVTGYLTGNYKTAFNKGKQQEAEQREKSSSGVKVQ